MNKTLAAAVRGLTIGAAAILALSAADAAPQVVSTDTSAPLTYVVRFADLDVSKSDDAKALYGRLRFAAKAVCRPLEGLIAWGSNQYRVCVDGAIADAVAKVNRPLLSQYSRSRTGKSRNVELAKAESGESAK